MSGADTRATKSCSSMYRTDGDTYDRIFVHHDRVGLSVMNTQVGPLYGDVWPDGGAIPPLIEMPKHDRRRQDQRIRSVRMKSDDHGIGEDLARRTIERLP